ncbi:MAG TPA: hypothetical protein VGB14_08980 [Acidimicrobiales bacterium]
MNAGVEPRLSSIASVATGDGLVLLGIDAGVPSGPGHLVEIEPTSGQLRTLADNPALNDLTNGFDVAADGCAYYSDGETLFTMDLATAALTELWPIARDPVAGISVSPD